VKKNKVFIHPTAIVESDSIGSGTSVWAFAHIMKDVIIGKDCNIGDHVFIESGVIIGNYITIKNNVMLWDGIKIEDGAFIGPGVIFTNDQYPRSKRFQKTSSRYSDNWLKKTLIMEGCSIGAGSVILCGIQLGKFSMVGAGSVVTKSIPDHALVFGNPARLKGYVCQCGELLSFRNGKSNCAKCHLIYNKSKTGKVSLHEK